MKRLLRNSTDYKCWVDEYKPDMYYTNSWAEDEPISYPCIVIYNEQEGFYTYKDTINYEFVYLNDFNNCE